MSRLEIHKQALCDVAGPADKETRFFGPPPETGHFDAPERLRAPAHFMTQSFLRQQERADWSRVDPRLAVWAAKFVLEMRYKWQIPLYVHTAFRGRAEQQAVFAKGNSRARYGRSAHNIGEAVDIVHGTFHWDLRKSEWLFLRTIGDRVLDKLNAGVPKARRLVLNWGGDFKSIYDPAHWEIADYRNRLRPMSDAEPLHLTPHAVISRFGGAVK